MINRKLSKALQTIKVFVGILVLILLAGCSSNSTATKKTTTTPQSAKENTVTKSNNATVQVPDKNNTTTNEKPESIQEENDSTKEDVNGQEEQENAEVPDISSIYLPVNGQYNNGSSDDFHYISVSGIDQSSFSFSIHEGMTGNLVFEEHVAVFEEQDETTAVYRGQDYTLFFDCSEYATITLAGFEEIISASENTFWNSNVLHTS